jgi:predicted ATPase
MLTCVSFENFKSIKKLKSLKLKPLTILTGPNASGKSAILEGISLFAEAARLYPLDGRNTISAIFSDRQGLWRYPRDELSNFISYKRDTKSEVNIEVELDSVKEIQEELNELAISSDLSKFHVDFVSYGITFRFSNNKFNQTVNIGDRVIITAFKNINDSYVRNKISGAVSNCRPGINVDSLFDDRIFYAMDNSKFKFELSAVRLMLGYLRERFSHVFLISGERGRIDAQLAVSNVDDRPKRYGQSDSPSWVGYRGEHVIEVLSRYFTREQKIAIKIQEWASKFQIPEIRAGYIGNGKLETNFVDRQLDTSLNASLAGLGSRQILPIIVQIFTAESGSTIMIEEPEISLHPASQVLLDELFATAISEGKQIICTTHSPFLILAINRIIKKGLLKVEDIAVYHVEKNDDGTIAQKLDLNKYGFLDLGIPSFMKTEQELLNEWSDTVED